MRWSHVIVGVAVVVLVVVVLARWPRPPAQYPPPDPGANARREKRPQFGPDESRPIQSTHIGNTREKLVAELGQPTEQGPWQIGFPKPQVFEKYKGLCTLEWHWESGKFLASIYPENGRWVCVNSLWVPKGMVPD